MNVQKYLQTARTMGIIPNFWLTEEYLSIQDTTVESNGKLIWIREGGWALFPPLPLEDTHSITDDDYPPLKIWSDFPNYSVGEKLEFLDWEYTYDADDFQEMEGSQWSSFRRNVRKWPRRNPSWEYTREPCTQEQVEDLLLRWLGDKREEEIHDHESLLHFLFHGKHRGFILKEGRLVGVNAWDVSTFRLVYRCCITDPEEPFLNEFARLLFYQSVPGELVIDGGTLGSKGLEEFKDKLNPVDKRRVHSRIIGKEAD